MSSGALTQIVLIAPLEPNLKVVIFGDGALELRLQFEAFFCAELVEELGKVADSVDRLPSGHLRLI